MNLIDTQRSTKTARMNIPRIEAPLVMSCKIPPDISLVISEPALYPSSCVYHKKAIRIAFHAIKKMSGPRMLPDAASDAPRAPRIGRTVNQKTGSPIPAKGPIIPILTPWMAASSIAAPFALSSSRASVTPMIGAATYG